MARPADKATALWVIRRLTAAGFEALLAGGCVRDMLLGHASHDYDVATDATPDDVRKVFRRVLLVGAQFGVAMVIHRGRMVEVTTFRSDESYTDGRRPDRVRYTTAREDALRRDFTVNGMFYDPETREIIDYVGGRNDIDRKVIRTIGKADDRFQEDYLRMLRAVRFSVRLGFVLEAKTARAIRRHAEKITSISGERVCDELTRMLGASSAAEALDQLDRLGLSGQVLGAVASDAKRWRTARDRVELVARRKDATLSLGALLLDVPVAEIRKLTRRWGAANELRDELCYLAGQRDAWARAADASLAEFKRWLARPSWSHLKEIWSAQEKLADGGGRQARRIALRAGKIDPDQIAPPAMVTGADLKRMGLPDGPEMGRILRELYTAQLNEQFSSPRDARTVAGAKVDGLKTR